MIEIWFPEPKGASLQVCISGHSGSGPKGHDLVCSAVSALILTMLGGFETVLNAKISGEIEEGNCKVLIEVEGKRSQTFVIASNIFRFGFLRLAQTYPNHVRITFDKGGVNHGT